MPASDRYWPAVLAAALILTAVLVGGIVWYLTTMLPLEIYVGHSPWSMLAFSNLCAATSGAFSIVTAFAWCFRAVARIRLRRRAIAGDLDAIPRARVIPHPDDVPDLTAEPLVVAWRSLDPSRGFMRVFIPSYLALLILVPLVDAGLVALSLRLGLNAVAIGICGTLAMIGMYAAVLARVMRNRALTKRVERVAATSDGLLWQRTGARDREIPWYDARLFEVWRPSRSYSLDFPHGYTLYGRENAITWHIPSAQRAAPEEMTANELETRQSLLLDLIIARTYLVPRTFEKSLQS